MGVNLFMRACRRQISGIKKPDGTVRRRPSGRFNCWDLLSINPTVNGRIGAKQQPPHIGHISRLDHLLSCVLKISAGGPDFATRKLKKMVRFSLRGESGWGYRWFFYLPPAPSLVRRGSRKCRRLLQVADASVQRSQSLAKELTQQHV